MRDEQADNRQVKANYEKLRKNHLEELHAET